LSETILTKVIVGFIIKTSRNAKQLSQEKSLTKKHLDENAI
jgi:hypothetical protein